MTSALSRIRDIALLLPEAKERREDDATIFTVADTAFAQARGDLVEVRDDEGGWVALPLADDADWALIEDRIAHSWELAAPRALLEAGGR